MKMKRWNDVKLIVGLCLTIFGLLLMITMSAMMKMG